MITSRVKCVTTLHTFPGMSDTTTTFCRLSRPSSPTTVSTEMATATNADEDQYNYVAANAPRIIAEACIEIVGDSKSDAYLCYACRAKPNNRMINKSIILGGGDGAGSNSSSPTRKKGSRPRSPTVFLSLAPCCRDEECQSLVRSVNDNFIHEVATAKSPRPIKQLPEDANKMMEDLEAEIAQSLTF